MTPLNETPGNEPAIAITDLCMSFGSQKVLSGLTFAVAANETVVILGRSGTGKSVLLKLLIGLQQPDSGSIRVHGEEITAFDFRQMNEVRKKMGFLFQQAALYDSLSVSQNVDFPLSRHTTLSAAARSQRVQELLASVGIEKDASKMPSEISGGMKKRVGLARALALEPNILLFDEPTAGLDPITTMEIDGLISKLKGAGKTASVVVTHDIKSARTLADRLIVLHEGNILAQGTFEELKNSKESLVVQFLQGIG